MTTSAVTNVFQKCGGGQWRVLLAHCDVGQHFGRNVIDLHDHRHAVVAVEFGRPLAAEALICVERRKLPGGQPINDTPSVLSLARRPRAFGTVLEPFVHSEVRKIIGWSEQQPSVFHFRDREGVEVDIVLEVSNGNISGIEIKAAASVSSGDFKGLRKLSESLHSRFTQGIVLYDGDQVVPFGDNLFAAPISSLWSAT